MSEHNEHRLDRREREKRGKEAELQRLREYSARLHNDRTTLLGMPEFQRVMADIVARSGLFQSVMTGNSMTYHKSGRQDFGREIFEDFLKVDVDQSFEILKPKTEK